MSDPQAPLHETWRKVVEELFVLSATPGSGLRIGPQQRAYLHLVKPVAFVEGVAVLAVPHARAKENIESELGTAITQVLGMKMGRAFALAVTIDPSISDQQTPSEPHTQQPEQGFSTPAQPVAQGFEHGSHFSSPSPQPQQQTSHSQSPTLTMGFPPPLTGYGGAPAPGAGAGPSASASAAGYAIGTTTLSPVGGSVSPGAVDVGGTLPGGVGGPQQQQQQPGQEALDLDLDLDMEENAGAGAPGTGTGSMEVSDPRAAYVPKVSVFGYFYFFFLCV